MTIDHAARPAPAEPDLRGFLIAHAGRVRRGGRPGDEEHTEEAGPDYVRLARELRRSGSGRGCAGADPVAGADAVPAGVVAGVPPPLPGLVRRRAPAPRRPLTPRC